MMKPEKMKITKAKLILAGVCLLALSATIPACNGAPSDPTGADSYILQAYLLRDLERDISASRVFFRQNNQPTPSGPVDIDTTRLDFVQATGMYQKEYTSASAVDTGIHSLTLQDDGQTILSSNLLMTGDFTINVSVPANRIFTGGGSVVVDLSSGSSNSAGYIFATVKASEIYTGSGWAGIVPALVSSGTFLPSVFQDTANNLDTGLYYIYMYSYSGSPRIDAVSGDFPTVMPDSVFLDNLSTSIIDGAFGTITVSRHDSIFVQQL
jgi:hypothetical protein